MVITLQVTAKVRFCYAYVRWLWHVFGGFFEAHKRAGRELLNANKRQIQMKIDKLVNVFESNVF